MRRGLFFFFFVCLMLDCQGDLIIEWQQKLQYLDVQQHLDSSAPLLLQQSGQHVNDLHQNAAA